MELEIPEGIMDAFYYNVQLHFMTLKRKRNSRKGSIYIVKPKMHGPEETAFTDLIFSKVEELFELEKILVKLE